MSTTIPTTMRASQWTSATGGLEKNLKLNQNAAMPKNIDPLPADSVLVKIAYSTLNPVDYKVPEMPILPSLLLTKPAIPGLDFSGTVVKSTRSDLKPGDRVCGKFIPGGPGTLADYVVAKGKEICAKIPDSVSLKDASAIGVCGTTAHACLAPYVKEGSKVFINGGSGGTGTFGIQIAKALGCYVTATCSGPNVELCKSLGADEVIDYRTEDVVTRLKRAGTQYDVIVDNVFIPGIYWSSHHYLKPTGKYLTIAGTPSWEFLRNILHVMLLPSFLGGGQRSAAFTGPAQKAETLRLLAGWMAEGKLKTPIERTYSLEEAGEAVARLKTGRVAGKLIIEIGGEE